MTNIDTLRAELAQAEAEAEAKRAAEAETIATARHHYNQRLIKTGKQYDEAAAQHARDAITRAETALTSGDLATAYLEWINYASTRPARYTVRAAVQAAARAENVHAYTDADLRLDYPGDTFTDWLQTTAQKHSRQKGSDTAHDFLGEPPATITDATEYLNHNR